MQRVGDGVWCEQLQDAAPPAAALEHLGEERAVEAGEKPGTAGVSGGVEVDGGEEAVKFLEDLGRELHRDGMCYDMSAYLLNQSYPRRKLTLLVDWPAFATVNPLHIRHLSRQCLDALSAI